LKVFLFKVQKRKRGRGELNWNLLSDVIFVGKAGAGGGGELVLFLGEPVFCPFWLKV